MKKGFTLVELLAVIVLLGVIAATTIPKIQDSIYESRVDAYNLVVSQLEIKANDYVMNKKLSANVTSTAPLDIYLSTLITEGYIKTADLEDPRYENKSIDPATSYVRFTLENGNLNYKSYFTSVVNP
jgi:prepilin-type N-terminal cleavage/methylation domain-containing protein